MRGVENDRIAGSCHDRQRAHVRDQHVVAEACAALGQENAAISRGLDLVDDVLDVPGGQELTLLHVDRRAGLARGEQEIGLATEKGRDLENVDGLGRRCALFVLVNVGQDRTTEFIADLRQDRQALLDPGAAPTLEAGAVGLVETRLEDKWNSQGCGHISQRPRQHPRVFQRLELAGTRYQGEGPVIPEGDIAHGHRRHAMPSRFMMSSISGMSEGLFNSQKARPRASTSTQRTGMPFSRKRSCSSPSRFSSGPSDSSA